VLSTRPRDLVQQVILGLIAWQSFSHLRHIAFFAIAFGWWMPLHVESVFQRLGIGKRWLSEEETRFGWAPPEDPAFTASLSRQMQQIFGVLLVFAIGVGGGQLVFRLSSLRVERDKYPADAFYFIAQNKLTGKMVCTFNWAQYALAAFGPREPGQPGILVQIDGRCRTSYSQQMLDTHFDFIMGRDDPNDASQPDSGPVDPQNRCMPAGPIWCSFRHQLSVEVMVTQTDHWVLPTRMPCPNCGPQVVTTTTECTTRSRIAWSASLLPAAPAWPALFDYRPDPTPSSPRRLMKHPTTQSPDKALCDTDPFQRFLSLDPLRRSSSRNCHRAGFGHARSAGRADGRARARGRLRAGGLRLRSAAKLPAVDRGPRL
jgi:hypothetical protein